MAYFIAPISFGLGDLVVSLPVVQALIDTGQDTYLVSRHQSQHALALRIEGLCGVIPESKFDPKSLNSGDSYINLREHPLQKNYWWGSPSFDLVYPGFKINDLLKIICKDFGIEANFEKLKRLPFQRVEKVEGAIVFVPGSDSTYKCWPKDKWLSVALFLKQLGLQGYVIGEPGSSGAVNELLPYLNWLPTPELADALDVISSAKAVIAVDTGLMHLAVHQGIPTIGLYRSHPIYERKYPHCFSISARACDARCIEESLGNTYNSLSSLNGFVYKSWQCQADEGQSCMNNIFYQSVISIFNHHSEMFLGAAATLS